ncbi:MAG: enoyl-CoA hydratase/isomerase family protein [Porticoccaceae bacterium]
MELKAFQFSIANGVAHITMDQPELGNPINRVFCEEYDDLSIACEQNPEVRAILIDANGTNFSLGGDLKYFKNSREDLPREFKEMTDRLHAGVARFRRMDAPVVIAADNLVVGGGAAVAAGADVLICTDRAKFYGAFAGIGVSGDTGMSHFLPRLVGVRKAVEFMMLNKMWSAQEALDNGLVSEIVAADELASRARAVAEQLAAGPTGAFGRMKRLLLSTWDQSLEQQLESEAAGMVACAKTEDTWNAINAVLTKQKPVFNNR